MYGLPAAYNPVVTNTPISIAWSNTTLTDIGTAITSSIAADGQTTITANLPMATFRHTGVGNATARTDYAAAGQIQDNSLVWAGTAGGTADALTITLTPALTAYVTGQRFLFVSGASPNATTTPTLAVNGLTAKTFKRKDGSAIVAGDIPAGTLCEAVYNGTNMLLNTNAVAGSTSITTLGTVTVGTWNASVIGAAYGGTGQSSYTVGDILYASGATALSKLAAGTAGYVFTSGGPGVAPGWASPSGLVVISPRTSNTILAASDKGNLIDITSGTFTQTFTAAATLGSGWFCYIKNSGTGDITLDPNASETIDLLASFTLYPGEVRLAQCDGSNFSSVLVNPGSRVFSSSGTFVAPPGVTGYEVEVIGGGGGGGSGSRVASGSVSNGGGGGGGGARVRTSIAAISAGTSVTITVGAGGNGGAVQTVNTTAGVSGTAGGTSSFGTYVSAYGGGYGIGGATSGGTFGGAGGGSAGTGTNGDGGSVNGGAPFVSATVGSSAGVVTQIHNIGGGGGAVWGTAGSPQAGNAEWGGGAGGCCDNAGGAGTAGGSSVFAAGGGGGGGGITTAPAARNGGAGGAIGSYSSGGGGAGGTAGGAGTAGVASTTNAGTGGGGGASATAAAGGAGAVGGAPGGGGGGGGASLNGNNSGAGGAGGRGEVRIFWR